MVRRRHERAIGNASALRQAITISVAWENPLPSRVFPFTEQNVDSLVEHLHV